MKKQSEIDTTSTGYLGSSENISFAFLNCSLKSDEIAAIENLAIGVQSYKNNFYQKLITVS